MHNFSDFSSSDNKSNNQNTPLNLFELVNSLAKKFDGKNQNELLQAIYVEAEKGKRNGSLTNEQLEAFAKTLAPFLDEKKKKILNKVVGELKKI